MLYCSAHPILSHFLLQKCLFFELFPEAHYYGKKMRPLPNKKFDNYYIYYKIKRKYQINLGNIIQDTRSKYKYDKASTFI